MQFSAFFTANETTNKVDVRLKELTQEYGKINFALIQN